MTDAPNTRSLRTALATERERAEKAEKERDERLEELGRVIMACPQGMRTSPASDGVKQLRASLAEAKRLLKPFADEAEVWGGYDETEALVEGWNGGPASQLKVCHLRAAASFLAQDADRPATPNGGKDNG